MTDEAIARMQALFREANAILRRAAVDAQDDAREVPFICECADRECMQAIRLTVAEYDRIRADVQGFAVAPGHLAGAIEDVLARGERFWSVRKTVPIPSLEV